MASKKQKSPAAPPPRPPLRAVPPQDEDDDGDLEQQYLYSVFTTLCVVGCDPSDDTAERTTKVLQTLDDLFRAEHPRERKEAKEDYEERVLDDLSDYVTLTCELIKQGTSSADAPEKAFAIIKAFDEKLGVDEDDDDGDDD